ncbi:MAG: hypothetical protein OEW95_04520 [Candidatus Bathyarchaeota archaeon]|nr:hypothetical protein [Candidatus Bathyarchaeota archaeon]
MNKFNLVGLVIVVVGIVLICVNILYDVFVERMERSDMSDGL